MSNYCYNTLKITCSAPRIMCKILEMIFAPDEEGNPEYRMGKILPMPAEFSTSTGYNNIGYHWCNSIWGTKWDVIESWHKLEGYILTIKYSTAWGPNIPWVKTFCHILYFQNYLEDIDSLEFSVEHRYWEWGMNFGGYLIWKLGQEIEHQEYELDKYAYLYDKCLYKWLIEEIRCDPYNPGWEKYNNLLEKISNNNSDQLDH
jgi:hypothetical protein